MFMQQQLMKEKEAMCIGRGESSLKMEGHDPKEPEQLRKLFIGGLSFETTDVA